MRILIFYKICLFLIGGVSSQCPSSTQPLLSNNQVLSCQPQEKCVCERMRLGSFCHYSSQHARYICCSSYSNQCMNGAPLLSNTGNVVTCFSNQNCQSGYTCTQQTCCASTMPALCSNSETNCLAGQALINGVCVNQVGLGGLCQDNAQCLGQSQCISGRCQCPTGSIASGGSCVNQPSCQLGTVSINGQCLSFSAPGNQCVASAQCIDSSQCMNSVCTCPSSMRNVNGYCIPYTGGPCLQTQTLVNSQCVTYSIIGGSCIADAQCVGGTYCQNSVCQCKQGTTAMYGYCISDYTVSCNSNQILVNGACYSLIPQGGFCMFQKQCMNNGQCMNGICQSMLSCNSYEVNLNGQCHEQVQPGGVCYLLKQCVGNSVCLNGLCQCGSGGSPSAGYCPSNPCGEESVLINYQCYSIVGPGSQCTWMQQCSGNTRCTNGYCNCPSNSILSNGQCSTSGNCGNNQVSINNQCYPIAQVGSSCVFTQQCTGNSQCLSGSCRCPAGSTLSNGQCSTGNCGNNQVYINNQCYPIAQVGSSCVYTQQCTGNSQCSNGYCQCPSGSSLNNGQCSTGNCGNNQVFINNQCYPIAQVGSSCVYTQQCTGNSQCSNGYCQCPSGSSLNNGQCSTGNCGNNQVFINNQCYPIAQVGSSCVYTQQCTGNSQCSNGYCQCPSGSSLNNGQCSTGNCGNNQVFINNQCYPIAQVGSSCVFTQQCTGNSQCLSGSCRCPTGSTLSNGQCSTGNCGNNQVYINNQCYPIAQVGSSCVYTQQCTGNSQCSNGYCQCPFGSSLNNGQCSTGNCGNNQVYINNQCYPIAQVGSSCVYTQQCTGNSQCSNGYCQCPFGSSLNNGQCSTGNCGNNQVFINNQCYPIAQVGSSCVFTQQCTGNSQCLSGFCRCSTGSTLSNGQCFNTGNCGNNQVSINNQCYPIAQVGSSCVFTQQCTGNSQCSNGYCQCPSGSSLNNGQCSTGNCGNNQVFINNQCYPIAQVGSSCVYTEQCTGNSQCSSGSCRCPTGSTLSNGQCFNTGNCGNNQVSINNQCYPIAQVGSSCVFTQQCTGNSQCSSGSCRCPTGSSLSNGQCSTSTCKPYQILSGGLCYDKVSIGQSCKIAAQCEVQGDAVCSSTCRCSSGSFNGTHCLSSVSSCSSGSVFVNSRCLSQVQLNQYCQFTPQCLGFGVCLNTFCVCPSNFVNINGTCRSTATTSSCPGNQILENGVCRCPSNMIDYGDGVCRNPSSDQTNICDAGEEPAYSNGQLNNCLYQACPTASYCKLNSRLQQYVCCKKTVSQIPTTTTCSNPAQTVVYENNKPLNCIYSNCPANAHCEYNNALSQYICCKSA